MHFNLTKKVQVAPQSSGTYLLFDQNLFLPNLPNIWFIWHKFCPWVWNEISFLAFPLRLVTLAHLLKGSLAIPLLWFAYLHIFPLALGSLSFSYGFVSVLYIFWMLSLCSLYSLKSVSDFCHADLVYVVKLTLFNALCFLCCVRNLVLSNTINVISCILFLNYYCFTFHIHVFNSPEIYFHIAF